MILFYANINVNYIVIDIYKNIIINIRYVYDNHYCYHINVLIAQAIYRYIKIRKSLIKKKVS